ncbi:MAG: hypothetical protein GX952_01195 [Firmicutes bacterium]|mgnify:CR=1 FL=1|nr:hypothetical protein [Bacillota bacterium]
MRSPCFNSRARRFLIAISILIIIALFSLNRLGGDVQRHGSRKTVVKQQSPSLLVEDCYYEGCGHNITEEQELAPDLRRLAPQELARLYNAAVYQVSEYRLTVQKSEPGLCPRCKEQVFVGIYQDKAAVFYGSPAGPHQLKEQTNIPVRKLPPQAVTDLRSGIPVNSQQELLQLLEGLMN